MRYRLKLNQDLKTNFILLPKDSPLTQSGASNSNGLHCTPIKISDISGQVNRYFGWTGGFSSEGKTIEISAALGRACGYFDDMLVQVQIEYSYSKLESVELEPLTANDFKIIEENGEYIED